jgi:neutral ceramidase
MKNMAMSCLAILFLTVSLSHGQSALKGNAKETILTPPLEWKFTLGGYGARMSRPAEAIHDDIKAKALVLNDGTKKYVIVTIDILGLPPNIRSMMIEKLAGTGWTEENIFLLPSHSHASLEMFALNNRNVFNMPAIGIFHSELMEFVVDKLVTLIKDTDHQLNTVKIGTGQVILDGCNRNRRGDKAVDQELTVTRVDLKNNQPLAVLVNWTAHPTIMDEDDMWVSGGWPGYLQRELKVWIGDLLIVGAPGEMIAELGLDIKSELTKAGVPYPVIGGLANEWISYFLTEAEYHQGGYETSVSFYGPALGSIIRDEMLKTAMTLRIE